MGPSILCIVVTTLAAIGCATGSGPSGTSLDALHGEPATSPGDVSARSPSPPRRLARQEAARRDSGLPGARGLPGPRGAPGAKKTEAPRGPRFTWPLRGRVTSPFGASSKRARHAGIDIDGEGGDPILAAADGEIVRIAENPRYGLLVVVAHARGYATWYAHASDLFVRKGDSVKGGQVIALVGESGNAHGSHLHFEVRRNGRPVDPLPFLAARPRADHTKR